MFKMGQKVVCVDDSHRRPAHEPASLYIRAGQVYTIRWVGECPFEPWREEGPCVRLCEVVRPNNEREEWSDFPFRASRFRAVVERKTDTGFAVLEEIRKRESSPVNEPVRPPVTAGER